MPCYSPLTGYKARHINESGKRGVVFNREQGFSDLTVKLPCGQCVGCRLERSRQWAMRCVHESSLYTNNCFITLTYSPENLPDDFGLNKQHFQKFMKRLRKRFPNEKIRYFHCGEYGEQNLRPHYHACLFNFDFPDKSIFSNNNDNKLYTSDILTDVWGFGFATIGDVTFDSAAYVARYIMKKVNINENTPEHLKKTYERIDPLTGEVYNVIPEYTTMSRRPGIGRDWYEKYKSDCYPSDFVIVNGKKMRPPKYYDSQYEDIEEIKAQRRKFAKTVEANNTPDRLMVREKCKKLQIKQLKRQLDED